MPSRNRIKVYGENQYYHAYNRGVDRMDIFRDEQDYFYMLSLFRRHLSRKPAVDKRGRSVSNYADKVELVTYCLMPNHYHFLFYLKEKDGIEKLMRSMMTSYSRYFNAKYQRVGSMFQSNFLASRITSEEYLWHVSRYIHLNPLDMGKNPASYMYSSYQYYEGLYSSDWLHEEKLVETALERQAYLDSLHDHEAYHELRHQLIQELASEKDEN